jgi:hypothetical protein
MLRQEAWLHLVDSPRSPKRPTLPGRRLDHHTVHAIMAQWRVQGWDMTRNKAGDETNRALVAYVRNLSDEELADLLVSLDPKVYQDLLERALRRQPRKRPPRVKP